MARLCFARHHLHLCRFTGMEADIADLDPLPHRPLLVSQFADLRQREADLECADVVIAFETLRVILYGGFLSGEVDRNDLPAELQLFSQRRGAEAESCFPIDLSRRAEHKRTFAGPLPLAGGL